MQCAYSAKVDTRRPYRQARQARLLMLIAEAGGPGNLMARTGVTDTHITACSKGRRDIGDEMAGSLERGMNKPTGWMDIHPPESMPYAVTESQPLRLSEPNMPPIRLAWEALMTSNQLPPEFETELPDNAMAPDAPRGTRVIFVRGNTAEPGDWILVRDSAGHLYCREYRQVRPGQWEAHARNPGFLPMSNDRDGLQVVAIFDGIRGRRAPL
jgi:hypothetical protein